MDNSKKLDTGQQSKTGHWTTVKNWTMDNSQKLDKGQQSKTGQWTTVNKVTRLMHISTDTGTT